MTEYVSDLQDLANLWGREFSSKYGTTCKWVDLHASRPEMIKYQQQKIYAKASNVRYEGNGTAIDAPGTIITDNYINDTSVQQTSAFKYSKSTSNKFSWTLKEGIKVGISSTIKFQIDVPPVVSGSTTLSTSLSFDATQSNTESETVTWSIDRNVAVPPMTKVNMIWTIKQQKCSATFHADIIMTGFFAIWNNDKIDANNPGGPDKHWLWFIPITTAFQKMREWGMSIPSLYSISDSSVTYTASGECQGEAGVGTTFDVEQTPLAPLPEDDTPATKIIPMFAIPAEVY